MIFKYLVAVVVLCLAGLLKSQEFEPDFTQRQAIKGEVCPWYWKKVCPKTVVAQNGVKYKVVNEDGISQCYGFKACRFLAQKCCVGRSICQQEYTWHQFTVHGRNGPISVWISVPATCNCLPISIIYPTRGPLQEQI